MTSYRRLNMPPAGHCSAYPQWWDRPNTATATLLVHWTIHGTSARSQVWGGTAAFPSSGAISVQEREINIDSSLVKRPFALFRLTSCEADFGNYEVRKELCKKIGNGAAEASKHKTMLKPAQFVR